MNLLRLLGLFIFSTAALLSAPESHVRASLVAADTSLQPGHPFTVALRLVHEPHWHTYWKNPGTGLATSLKWQLPDGFKAGAIQWPAPSMLKDREGAVIGSGYEGETFLLVTITPPTSVATGSVELKAKADWLMCSDVCVPGGAPVSLTLPVSLEAAQPNPEWSDKLKAASAALPRALPEGSLSARQEGSVIILTVRADQAASPGPRSLHFFEEDNVIAFDQPQTEKSVAGGSELRLTVSAEGPQDAPRLRGVLTSETGWGGHPLVRGISVDIPLSRSSAGTTSAASKIVPAQSPPAGSASLGATLLLAFVGGLILNLMPCVFPVLGIKILGFVNQAGHARSKVIAHGLIFASGVLLSFWTLAGVLAILRAGGSQLGWGFQLQSPAFVFVLAALMLVFALNMSGVFEFGLRATSVGGELQTKTGYAGSFFTGVLATVVATPCSAPFLAPALGAALALSTLESFAIFTAIAVGLALPYLLLSIFPGAVKILPRPGAWMETFKQFMAFPLYATVGYLIWVLAGQVADEGLQNILFGLVLIALGVWFYGRWNAPGASVGRVRFGVAALIVAGGCGVWLGWPQAVRGQGTEHAGVKDVVWEPWSPEAVEKLRAAGRVVYVDFTARWCATCQANKKLVFHSDEVLKALAAGNVATLRADWTNNDPRITAELAKYHRSAVPFNVIWGRGQPDPILLPELLTPGVVLDALKQADKK